MITDLLWADPSAEIDGFEPSKRGTSYLFGLDVVEKFLGDHEYDLLCRAHQVIQEGFEFPFYPEQRAITIFSAPDYCGLGNKGAMLRVDESMSCNLLSILPDNKV